MKKNYSFFTRVLMLFALITTTRAQTTIFSENFNGSTLPSGWSVISTATDGGFIVGSANSMGSVVFPIPNNGTNIIATSDSKCNCDKSNDRLLFPKLNMSSYTHLFLSLDKFYFASSNQGKTESAVVLASTDSITWNVIDSIEANAAPGYVNQTIDISSLAGQAAVWLAIKYSDGGGWLYGLAMDNIKIYEPPSGLNLALTTVEVGKQNPMPAFTPFSKYLTGLPLTLRATIANPGTITVNSFDIVWSDGINTHTKQVSGVSIAPLATYIVEDVGNPYITLSGAHTITAKIQNINNGATDINTANNNGSFTVTGVAPHPDKNILAEEATGAWCGFCVRGIVFMDYMRQTYPNKFMGVAVHEDDIMEVSGYSLSSSYPGFSGYPSVVINRSSLIDPMDMEESLINEITQTPPVVIGVNAVMDANTRLLTVNLTGNFSQNLSGDYRFNAVVTEDSVHVLDTAYSQVNYYTANAYGPMGGFENLPEEIPSANMYYDFVARKICGQWAGTAGSLPATISSGSVHNYTFTYTVPANYNAQHLKVVGMVIANGNGKVQNVNSAKVTIVTGIADVDKVLDGLDVYPNPFTGSTTVEVDLKSQQQVRLTLTDILGNEIRQVYNGTMPSGKHNLRLEANTLSSGIYFLRVNIGGVNLTKKLVVQ